MPTYRNVVDEIAADWEGFRRALREEDRQKFDEMLRKARQHASAGGYDLRLDPTESIFISILLEHEKELSQLRKARGDG